MLIFGRNRCNSFLRSTLLLLFSSSVFASSIHQINFDEAVRYALNTNPRINASNANIDAANAAIIEARGNNLPKVNLNVNAARSNNPLNVFSYKLSQGNASFADFGADKYTGPSALNVMPRALNSPGQYSNVNTGFALSIPIFSGGKSVAAIKKSHYLLNEAQHGNQFARNELTFDVLQAYEGTRVANELVTVAQQSLRAADSYLKMTKALLHQSLLIESDVLLAETNRRSAELTLKAAKTEVSNQLDAFRMLIGNTDNDLVPGNPVNIPLPCDAITVLKNRALSNNPQLLSLKSHMNASRAEMSEANASNWPQVDLQLRHDWNANSFALNGPSNTALLNFNWELFSSGAQYGAGKHALAEYKHAAAEFDNSSNTIKLAVVQAARAAYIAQQRLEISNQNAEAANKAVKILLQRFGQGIVPLGQLLDSQSRLDTARSQRVMERYSMNIARARLLTLLNEFNPASIQNYRISR